MKKILLIIMLVGITNMYSQVFKLASGSSTTFFKKEGSTGWIDISNSVAMPHDMVVKFTLTGKNSGAVASVDLTNYSNLDTIVFGPNATTRRFNFKTVLDNTVEGNDTFIFKLTQAVTMGTIGTPDSVIFIVTDSTGTTPIPSSRPLYTIGKVRGNNTSNVPDSNNVLCTLRGVLYGDNILSSTGYRYSLCDGTGCIGINSTKIYSNYSNPKEGDSVEVSGKVSHFSGLGQLNFNSTGDTIKLLGSKTIATPTVTTTLNESTESNLVKIQGLQFVSGTWYADSSFDITVKNAASTTYSVRINNKGARISSTNPMVTGKVYDILGLGSQFAPTTGNVGGYQLSPRRKSDFIELTGNAISSTSVGVYSLKVYPNPVKEENLTIEYKTMSRESININLVDMSGRPVFSQTVKPSLGANKLTINNVSQYNKGVYFVLLNNSSTNLVKKIIIE